LEKPEFVRLLNAMRFGQLTDEMCLALSGRHETIYYHDDIEPTELFPVRSQVDDANSLRLAQLPRPELRFITTDLAGINSNGYPVDPKDLPTMLERMLAPGILYLRPGAQVSFVHNAFFTLTELRLGDAH
jgi:hypothetical protein